MEVFDLAVTFTPLTFAGFLAAAYAGADTAPKAVTKVNTSASMIAANLAVVPVFFISILLPSAVT